MGSEDEGKGWSTAQSFTRGGSNTLPCTKNPAELDRAGSETVLVFITVGVGILDNDSIDADFRVF